MLKRRFYPLMNEQGEGGDPGAGAGAADGAGEGAAAGASSTGAEDASLLAGGANATQTEFIPEKFKVNKEDGTLDLEASSRKMAENYGLLEKRLGTADAPPKSAEEYTVDVPDAFKESFDPTTDEGFKGFAGKMHALGLSQKQMDGVMAHYFEMAPQLVAGAAMLDTAAAKTQLEQVWASNGGFDHQIGNAYQGATVLAQKAGIPIDEIMAPNGLGNNVHFLRLAAAIAPEFAEDKSPGGSVMSPSTEEQIHELMRGEAYTNTRHPDHEKVSDTVRKFFEKKHGTAAVA